LPLHACRLSLRVRGLSAGEIETLPREFSFVAFGKEPDDIADWMYPQTVQSVELQTGPDHVLNGSVTCLPDECTHRLSSLWRCRLDRITRAERFVTCLPGVDELAGRFAEVKCDLMCLRGLSAGEIETLPR
jgi:hypothetical protein